MRTARGSSKRSYGMTWFKLPLFLWGLYATAIIQVLATPVLEPAVKVRHLRQALEGRASEVFCERIVETSSLIGSRCARQRGSPYTPINRS